MKVYNGLALLLILFFVSSVFGDGLPYKTRKKADEKIKALDNIGVAERLGTQLDLSVDLVDESGKKVKLGNYFDGKKPVLLTLVYYSCPSLCNFHLNGLTETFKKMKWTVGKEFDIVAISFEEKDTSDLAAAKKASYVESYGKPGSKDGWHFLTGSKENVKKIADQVGFKYKWQEETQEWAHASVAYVVTPDGVVSRYLYGVGFEPRTMRLSLVEAGNGKIGTIVDKIILYCFNYNPEERKYSLVAFNSVRAGAGLTVLLLGLFLIPFWVKQLRGRKTS